MSYAILTARVWWWRSAKKQEEARSASLCKELGSGLLSFGQSGFPNTTSPDNFHSTRTGHLWKEFSEDSGAYSGGGLSDAIAGALAGGVPVAVLPEEEEEEEEVSDEEGRLNHDLLPTSQQLSWSDRRSRSADEVGAAVVNSLARGDWDRLLLGAGMDQSALLEMRREAQHHQRAELATAHSDRGSSVVAPPLSTPSRRTQTAPLTPPSSPRFARTPHGRRHE